MEQARLGEIPASDDIAAFHRARELGAVWAALKQDPKGVAREVAGRLLPMLADGVLDIASLGSQAYQRAFAETLLQKIGTGGREEMLAALQSGDGLFAFYDEAHKAGSKAQLLSLAGLALGIATGGVAGLAKTTMGRVGTMIGGGAVSVTVPPALAALPEEGVKGALGSALKALVEGGALIALGIKGKGAHTSVSMGELIRSNASRLETLKGLAPRDAAALVHGVLQDNGIAGVRVAPAAVLETLQKAEKAFPALSVDPVLVALRDQAQKALAEEGTLFLPADAALSEIATRLPDLADHMELQTAADRGRAAGEGMPPPVEETVAGDKAALSSDPLPETSPSSVGEAVASRAENTAKGEEVSAHPITDADAASPTARPRTGEGPSLLQEATTETMQTVEGETPPPSARETLSPIFQPEEAPLPPPAALLPESAPAQGLSHPALKPISGMHAQVLELPKRDANTFSEADMKRAEYLGDDPAQKKISLHEGLAAIELERTFGWSLERVEHTQIKGEKNADLFFSDGPFKGKTIDFMWTNSKSFEGINQYFQFNLSRNRNQLMWHLGKADFIPLDYRSLIPENQKIVDGWIRGLTPDQQRKILIIR